MQGRIHKTSVIGLGLLLKNKEHLDKYTNNVIKQNEQNDISYNINIDWYSKCIRKLVKVGPSKVNSSSQNLRCCEIPSNV